MPGTVLSPQPDYSPNSISMSGKRKRDVADAEVDAPPAITNGVDHKSQEMQAWMTDILEILRRYDDAPSLVDRKLFASTTSKSSPKRLKVSEPTSNASIARKVTDNVYNTIEDLENDLDHAGKSRLEEIIEQGGDGDTSKRQLDKERLRISTLKERLQALKRGEIFLRPQAFNHRSRDAGAHLERKASLPDTKMSVPSHKTVLTLYGGDRSAKQLFSSWANPGADTSTLGDVPLPNGISTTIVVPVHSLGEGRDKVPTIGESFPPPANVKPLNPPKPSSRHTSTRSTTINWHNPSEAIVSTKESNPRDPYYKQTLPTGRWLTYNVAPSTEQMTSPGSKRRHRDRALSTGEPQSAIDAETSAAHAQAKDDALFRSVYSSFAPSRDDEGAIVSQEQKNRVWWAKHGEARYHEALDIRDEALYTSDGMDVDVEEEKIDPKLMEEGLANWTSNEDEFNFDKKPTDSQGSDELLEEISELLEILNSHQRVRNLSQSTTTRPIQGQKEQLTTVPSDYSTPSAAEFEVYENLKSHLVQVISTLPPYMLAKIDGDKLGALAVNSRIKHLGKYQKGTLQEDNPKSRTTANPAHPASYPATNVRGGYVAPPSQQYSQRPAYGQTPVPRPTPAANSYSTYSARPPSASQYTGGNPRPAYNQYPPQRSASSYVDRFTNGQLGHQQSPQYSQYSNSYRPQINPSYPQQYPTGQPARMPAASPPTAQAYQQRAPPPPAYNYNPPQSSSSASPQIPQNAAFGNQVAQRPALSQRHSSHYGSRSPAENHNTTNGINADGQGRMSPIDRTASTDGRKQHSVTPQPLASEQTSQQNGTPAPPRQNGVAI